MLIVAVTNHSTILNPNGCVIGTLGGLLTQSWLESFSILGAHQIVEYWVEGGRKEVEATGEVEEVLVERSPFVAVLEVNIAKPLDVEWNPGNEEENDNSN